MKDRIHNSWRAMISRCNCKSNNRYKNYGGRGIKVCDEWKNSFQAFYEWAITNGYSEGMTIDRKDVNGNYEPSNCRWITMKEQANNRRNNVFVCIKGETKTLSEWADLYGIDRRTVNTRIKKGWTIEDALTKPVDERKRNKRSVNYH